MGGRGHIYVSRSRGSRQVASPELEMCVGGGGQIYVSRSRGLRRENCHPKIQQELGRYYYYHKIDTSIFQRGVICRKENSDKTMRHLLSLFVLSSLIKIMSLKESVHLRSM